MLKAAQQAEDNFTSMQRIACNSIGLSQAFLAIAHATGSNRAMALPSQAKTTLSQYSPWGGRPTKSAAGQGMRTARPVACYGCGGPHPWLEYQQGSYIIICPNQNNQGNSFAALPVMATGPPPSAPHHVIPSIPAIHLLTASIIRSIDHLFFVSHRIGLNDAREWQLVWVAFEDLMSLYPLYMQDGRFLFEFYI
jgi:hypothetical protein